MKTNLKTLKKHLCLETLEHLEKELRDERNAINQRLVGGLHLEEYSEGRRDKINEILGDS
jgi:hypothetical protein